MKPIQKTRRTRPILGFSMVELLASVSILAILATIAMTTVGQTGNMVKSAKLKSDVQKLNEVVAVYLASGGSLADISDPQEVLNHLKTVVSQSDKTQNVGVMTGRGVDERLVARLQSSSEASSSAGRALWDKSLQKFVFSNSSGAQGIASFELDGKLAGGAVASEKRKATNVLYNGSDGWVWASGDPTTKAPLAPASHLDLTGKENKYNPVANGAPSGGSVTSTSSTSGTVTTTTKVDTTTGITTTTKADSATGLTTSTTTDPATGLTTTKTYDTAAGAAAGVAILPSPIINPPGGSFYSPMFPSAVYINSNGAPSSSSYMKYKINDGPWAFYSGPFTVKSGTKVTAMNFSTDLSIYADSPSTVESYYSLVPAFTGTVLAKWNASSGPSTLKSSLNNTNPDSVVESNGTISSSSSNGQNTFTFNRVASFTGVAPNTSFKIGQIVYHNGTIVSGTGSTGLNLHLDIAMSTPAVASTGSDISMTLNNTKNTTTGSQSADSCTLANPVTNYSIRIDGVTYTLIVRYGNIDSTEGFVSGNTVNVWEGATGHVDIQAIFASTTPQ